ncbi:MULTISPECIES: glutaredoxin domain-containing protein [Kocuria]|uniref:glutaredoxin domain-containing protein n=1 Tax=Kocuria TaxID=57493 RepID=UPI0007EA7B2E|nr:glutaredoxin domain-containing protein [Kocuria sp. ICS0012]OBA50682.1 NrdH-redoxin [Kocuria sp. ICS0012]
MLIIYTTPGCTDCASTCRALTRRGVPYRTVDLSTDPKALEHVRSLGYAQAPVCIADTGEHWSGFRPDRLTALTRA